MPAVATDKDADDFKIPKSQPNKNKGKGTASDTGAALAKAKKSKKRHEVKTRRNATQTWFANPDGSLTRETSLAPVRAKDADGDWVSIDTTLSTEGKRLEPKNATGDVSFSKTGADQLATFDLSKDTSVGLSFDGDLSAPTVKDSVATYDITSSAPQAPSPIPSETSGANDDPSPSVSAPAADDPASGGVKLKTFPYANGFGTRIELSKAPAEAVTYRFKLTTDGLRPALKNGMLEFTNADGKVVAASRPLEMWDAQRDDAGDPTNVEPVKADLVKSGDGYDLVLSPSQKFLTDPKTQYPLEIDPDISSVASSGDTWYYEGQLSTSGRKDNDYKLLVGKFADGTKARSFLSFAYKSYLGTNVTKATLKIKEYANGAVSCAPQPTYLFPMMGNDSSSPWWGHQPQAQFDDPRFYTLKSFNRGLGNPGCSPGFEDIDITPMVNGWAGEHLGKNFDRQGMVLRAENESDVAQNKRFCSKDFDPTQTYCADASVVPVLSVTYMPELGAQSWYSMTDHQLNNRSGLSINNKTGNLVVSANDVNVNGVGLDLDVTRTYNSQASEVGAFGQGWRMSVGPDVWLERKSTYRYDFHGPNGTVLGSFVRDAKTSASERFWKFTTPIGGVGADLEQNPDTKLFTLKVRGSRTKYTFSINSADSNAYLTKLEDRSDNAITFAYGIGSTPNTNRPKLASISDSSGRTYAITYTGDYITKIAQTFDPDGVGNAETTTREWKYGYTSGYLTSYTDPENHTTNYAYEDVTSGPDLLDTITNPQNQSGRRPTTTITYGYDAGADVNQVVEASYRYGTAENDTYDYTWDYRDTRPARCEGNGTQWTVVTDPNSHDTTYCFKPRTDSAPEKSKTWVYDALGNAKSAEYSADNGPENVTDPSGQGPTTDGSTIAEYSQDVPDRLEKVTEPKSDSVSGRATTGYAYGTAGSNGGVYQPTAVKDSSGNCNRFGYDDKGRTTDAFTGVTASSDSASTCNPTGGKRFQRKYNDNGTVREAWDANAGSDTPADSAKTIYTYWAAGDTDFVAGTAGQLKSVRKPGGDCSATVAAGRRLCTTYEYDGAGRVASVTNGNAKKTTYRYDKMDRTTGAFFDGATSCNLGSSNCHVYGYDAEGNLTSRREGFLPTSSFGYDQLNRQVVRNNSNGTQGTDQLGMAYDGTGNLTVFAQLVVRSGLLAPVYDQVNYGYDAANRLKTVTDSTGTIDVDADADGRTKSITFPKPSGSPGMKVDYDYSKPGKPKRLNIKSHAGSSLAAFNYSYVWSLYGGALQAETSQMRNRTVTGGLSHLNGNVDFGYNSDGQLTSAGSTYTYTYDNVGNIRSEKVNSTTTRYGYNKAGELCWQGPTSDGQADTTAPPTACGSTPSGNTALNRDPAGNNTRTASEPIYYNDRDQVTRIGEVTMEYRDVGNGLRREAGATKMVQGPMGITATYHQGTNIVTFYTRDPQGTILNSHDVNGTRNYVTEFNGSVAALYNPSGTAVGSYRYSPYGATNPAAESGGTTAANNPFRYISGYQDKTSSGADGYYKLGARYYDGRGHFTQPDPIIPGGGAYHYADGDPINSADPSGLESQPSMCGVWLNGHQMLYPGCPGYKNLSDGYPMRRRDHCTMVAVGAYPAVRGVQAIRAGLAARASTTAKADGVSASFGFGTILANLKGCFS